MDTVKKPRKTRKSIEIPPQPEYRDPVVDRYALRRKVEMFYDVQRLRLAAGGRSQQVVAGKLVMLSPADVAVLAARALDLKRVEHQLLGDIEAHLQTSRFYREKLSRRPHYAGVGPTMAGVIMSSFDIEREDTVSKMWSFAGLAPTMARRCKTCHSVLDPVDVAPLPGTAGGLVAHVRQELSERPPEAVQIREHIARLVQVKLADLEDDRPVPSAVAQRLLAGYQIGCECAGFKHKVERKRGLTKPGDEDDAPKLPVCAHAGDVLGLAGTYASGEAARPYKGEKLPFNRDLRTKLVGVLGPVLLKLGRYRCLGCGGAVVKGVKALEGKFTHKDPDAADERGCPHGALLDAEQVLFTDRPGWFAFYRDYKHRKETTPGGWGRNDAHRHQAATRYMVKMLLLQVWLDWRRHLDLPIRPSYHEEKQGGHGYAGGPPREPVETVLAYVAKEAERFAAACATRTVASSNAGADLGDEIAAEIATLGESGEGQTE